MSSLTAGKWCSTFHSHMRHICISSAYISGPLCTADSCGNILRLEPNRHVLLQNAPATATATATATIYYRYCYRVLFKPPNPTICSILHCRRSHRLASASTACLCCQLRALSLGLLQPSVMWTRKDAAATRQFITGASISVISSTHSIPAAYAAADIGVRQCQAPSSSLESLAVWGYPATIWLSIRPFFAASPCSAAPSWKLPGSILGKPSAAAVLSPHRCGSAIRREG